MLRLHHNLKNKKVLITCGPTWVAIDDTRVISNKSTGELGHRIAEEMKKAGARVTILEGPVSCSLKIQGVKIIKYTYFRELANLLRQALRKNFDIVIHSAAVSDYRAKNTVTKKIRSDLKGVTLRLIPTEKLINQIKKISPKTFLVGFKLESSANLKDLKKRAGDLIRQSRCDLVVANSIKRNYTAYILDKNIQLVDRAGSRNELARKLTKILEKQI